jgi:hypothetical protein
MPQIGLFPLSDEELKVKGKELAGKIEEIDALEEEKDSTSRRFNERIKVVQGEIRALAKEIHEEKAEREAGPDEAPWQGLIDQAEGVAKRGRRRTRRGVDGEVIEESDDG